MAVIIGDYPHSDYIHPTLPPRGIAYVSVYRFDYTTGTRWGFVTHELDGGCYAYSDGDLSPIVGNPEHRVYTYDHTGRWSSYMIDKSGPHSFRKEAPPVLS